MDKMMILAIANMWYFIAERIKLEDTDIRELIKTEVKTRTCGNKKVDAFVKTVFTNNEVVKVFYDKLKNKIITRNETADIIISMADDLCKMS